MKVVLQNVLDTHNKCFYYAFLGAARDYLKKCKFFKTNKKKINVDFLKQENLNFDRIKSNPIQLALFRSYLSRIFEFYRIFVNGVESDENIRNISEYDVNDISKEDIKNIISNTKLKHPEKIEKIKEILLKTENLAIMFGLDYNICHLFFIKYKKLKNYDFILDDENKINSILKDFIEIQFNHNSFTTQIELKFFTEYLNEKCSKIEIKTIAFRKHGNFNFFRDNEVTKKYFYNHLIDFFKDILKRENKEKTYVFLFTTDSHYNFLILNNKSIFTFQDISDLYKNLLDSSEAFEFTNIDTINSDYGKSIEFSPEPEPKFQLVQQLPLSPHGAKTKKSSNKVKASLKQSDVPSDWEKFDVPPDWEKFDVSSSSESPELATSRSPQRNMLKEDKHINLILNLPTNLTTLSKNTEYDKIITLSIDKVNSIFSKYEKLKKLEIVKKNKIYKFNYKYPEKYLYMLSDTDLKQIILEIKQIIKIPNVRDFLSLLPSLPKRTQNIPDLTNLSSSNPFGLPSSPKKTTNIPDLKDFSPTSKSPELATSRSPQRNMLKEDKLINLILNLPINLTTLSQNTKNDNSIDRVNITFSKYEKLKNLKIVKKNKIYKFNYKYPEKYLYKLSDTDLKQIREELFL